MNTPVPVSAPAPIPWYRSAVLQGLLVAAATQVLLKIKNQYNIDLSVYGIDASSLASWVLNIISAAALTYAAHGRIAKPLPPVTFRKTPPPSQPA